MQVVYNIQIDSYEAIYIVIFVSKIKDLSHEQEKQFPLLPLPIFS